MRCLNLPLLIMLVTWLSSGKWTPPILACCFWVKHHCTHAAASFMLPAMDTGSRLLLTQLSTEQSLCHIVLAGASFGKQLVSSAAGMLMQNSFHSHPLRGPSCGGHVSFSMESVNMLMALHTMMTLPAPVTLTPFPPPPPPRPNYL